MYCKSLPFFLFSNIRKGRLLYIRPVGWLVGWSTSPLIFSIYTGIKALYKPSTTQYQSVPSDNDQVQSRYEERRYEERRYEERRYEKRRYEERHYEERHYKERLYEERHYEAHVMRNLVMKNVVMRNVAMRNVVMRTKRCYEDETSL